MKHKVECTHIVSQLLNIKKYKDYPIIESDGKMYIEVNSKSEKTCITEMEHDMHRALWWYGQLIIETSK